MELAINAPSNDFRGFMIQARRTSGNTDEAIGIFGAPPSGTRLLACPEGVSLENVLHSHTYTHPYTHTPTHPHKIQDGSNYIWGWLKHSLVMTSCPQLLKKQRTRHVVVTDYEPCLKQDF